jgi:hypothetical protein
MTVFVLKMWSKDLGVKLRALIKADDQLTVYFESKDENYWHRNLTFLSVFPVFFNIS